ncbi:hypothetical protein U9M48_012200 [Paspalum notatum var. saurae]|uniref:Uncharacterized protein n=1 Tax=Paspalum notatum var. saurae TaxID=547442 RepID=A0AAQ3SXT2_PASNO
MARTKQAACKATGARITVLPNALREMGHRPCPFISVQTVHEEGDCMVQVVLPRGMFAGQETITLYGANEEEAYRKAVMAALTSLSSGWEAGHTVLRYLPTNDLDHAWLDCRE